MNYPLVVLSPSAVSRDASCSRCDLGIASQPTLHRQSLCIPLHRHGDYKPSSIALLCIGEAPGSEEDAQCAPFVGPSGQILTDWLSQFASLPITIYATNAVRCRLPTKAKPRRPMFDACNAFLVSDLKLLLSAHPSVTLLLLGATTVESLRLGTMKKDAFRRQGQPVLINGLGPFPTYATYHPAATLPSRSPHLVHAVADHLSLLFSSLDRAASAPVKNLSAEPSPALFTPPRAVPVINALADLHGPVPSPVPSVLALDIETYGLLDTEPVQTVYHPVKSTAIDRPRSLLSTVAIAWHQYTGREQGRIRLSRQARVEAEGSALKARVYVWSKPVDRASLYQVLHRLRANHGTLVLKNALFDFSYLRAYPEFREVLCPPLVIEDVEAWNTLASDVRPERSLEAIARLLGLLPELTDSNPKARKFKRYPSAFDGAAHRYNATDALVTLAARDILRGQCDPLALTEYARRWFSESIYSFLHMQEAGICVDRRAVATLNASLLLRMAAHANRFKALTGCALAGTGSRDPLRTLVANATAEACLLRHPQLARSDVGGIISTGEDNIKLILEHLPSESAYYESLGLLTAHRALQKTVGTLKAIASPESKHRSIRGIVYPQWYPFPGEYGRASNATGGGTVQGRATAKDPAPQTWPEEVHNCVSSRHGRHGVVLMWDLSQIEVRLAAMLSRDSRMIQEYRDGVDRHTMRAVELFGADIISHPQFRRVYRHAGKTMNFLIIYRGGARQFRFTLRRDVGVDFPLERCQEMIALSRAAYPELDAYQQALIRQVTRDGFLVEPVLGFRRWFIRSQALNEHEYESTIANFLVQSTAALLMRDVQRRVITMLPPGACVFFNGYDSLGIDCLIRDYDKALNSLRICLTESGYLARLRAVTGVHDVPILAEAKARCGVDPS